MTLICVCQPWHPCNNCAETHLGGGVLKTNVPFASPLPQGRVSWASEYHKSHYAPLLNKFLARTLITILLILSIAVVMSYSGNARAGNNNDAAKRYSMCERAHG